MANVGHTTVRGASAGTHQALLYVAPGALVTYRVGATFVGLDLTTAITPAQAGTKWAPSAMLAFGVYLREVAP